VRSARVQIDAASATAHTIESVRASLCRAERGARVSVIGFLEILALCAAPGDIVGALVLIVAQRDRVVRGALEIAEIVRVALVGEFWRSGNRCGRRCGCGCGCRREHRRWRMHWHSSVTLLREQYYQKTQQPL